LQGALQRQAVEALMRHSSAPRMALDRLQELLGQAKIDGLSLRFNSNLTGISSDKWYPDKSAVSTKASASVSLLSVGSFFFLGRDFLAMHGASARRPRQQ
jgi:hypothetical protein